MRKLRSGSRYFFVGDEILCLELFEMLSARMTAAPLDFSENLCMISGARMFPSQRGKLNFNRRRDLLLCDYFNDSRSSVMI